MIIALLLNLSLGSSQSAGKPSLNIILGRNKIRKSSACKSWSWTDSKRASPAMNIVFMPLIMNRSQTLREAYKIRKKLAYTLGQVVREKAYKPLKRK
jgi:hypothetical protein